MLHLKKLAVHKQHLADMKLQYFMLHLFFLIDWTLDFFGLFSTTSLVKTTKTTVCICEICHFADIKYDMLRLELTKPCRKSVNKQFQEAG